jgi:preprotein translocase subunit YajC
VGHTKGNHVLVAAADSGTGGNSFGLIMIVLLIGAMYFLMIRPQSKRRREAVQMQAGLGPGDEVMTGSGLYGTVTELDNDTVTLEVSPGVTVKFARAAIGRVLAREEPAEPEESAPGTVDNTDAQKTIEQA